MATSAVAPAWGADPTEEASAAGLRETEEERRPGTTGPLAATAPQALAGTNELSTTVDSRTGAVNHERTRFAAGTTIGHYEVLRPLGQGGMGEVYLARDTRLGRRVALKFLLRVDPPRSARFTVEARATAQLSHESLVALYDIAEHEGLPYMVLEYVPGKTLATWLEERRAAFGVSRRLGVPPERAAELMLPVARALVCAHAAGIVHRDLKPENIMLTENGTVKVLDLGIAKLLGEPAAAVAVQVTSAASDLGQADTEGGSLTHPGAMMGTVAYMSPEQWGKDVVDERTDLWAVGILLYEMVTGEHPLAPLSMLSLVDVTVLDRPMPSVLERLPGIGRLGAVIDRCLIKHKAHRLGSAEELLAELSAVARPALGALDAAHDTLRAEAQVQRAEAERSAAQARNAMRMAAARERQEDPTTVLALLREMELGSSEGVGDPRPRFPLPRGWAEFARWTRDAGVASGVLLHDAWVCSAAFSPDGQRIVSAAYDKTVQVWNADGQGQPLVLRGHDDRVYAAAFSPDGERIVSASADKTARVWKADGEGLPLVLRGHDDRVYAAAFSPDGERIVSASNDKTIRVWKADGTGEPLVLRGHDDRVFAAAFSPDGERIVSASEDKTVRVWRADGEGLPLVLRGHDAIVRAAAFSPDGKRIVSASLDKTVRVWRADGAGQPLVLRGHDGSVFAAAFSPDGERIVSASGDKTARVWRADGEGQPLVLRGHAGAVVAAAFRPDGQRLASASWDKTVRVWKADGEGQPLMLRGHEDAVLAAAFSPDGKRIVSASDDTTVRVWQADGTGQPVVLRGHDGSVFAAAFSPDGERIVSASGDKTARVWKADGTGEPLVLRGHEDFVFAAAWSPDGERIVSASGDKTARVWRADGEGLPLVLRGHEDRVYAAAFSPDGQRIVSASLDKTVRVWRADGQGQPLVLRGHEDVVHAAVFSPDGRRIASASEDKTVRVWRADGQGQPLVLRGHEAAAFVRGDRAFSPDGTRLVSSSNDATVRVWNADGTGEPLVLRASNQGVNSASWSPDGRRIVAATEDKTIIVWSDLEPISGVDDPKLWTATSYCMSLEVRERLLGFSEEQSRKDLERCQRKVREARSQASGRLR